MVKSRVQVWVMALLLVLLTIASYWPALHNGFIWDDDAHLTNNPHLRDLAGLVSLWTTSAARICPLVLTSFWVQKALWGLVPWPYHLVNILLHAASGLVLWQVLRALRVRGAWLGAALWVLHPVAVESVAWITELKNTQSALFYLLAIWCFVQWRQGSLGGPRPGTWKVEKFYALALLCGALGMASKSSTVVLPLVLGLCAWWVEGRWNWRTGVRLAPFFAFSAVAAALSLWTQGLEGALDADYARSGPERLVTAGKVVWFYLGKLAWPHPLVFIYPRWKIEASQAGSYLPLTAAGATVLVLWWKRKGWGRPVFFAWAYFLIALLPVLGLFDHYFLRYSFVGDHFQYLASIGPLALAGAGLAVGLDLLANGNRLVKPVGCGLLLGALGGLTWGRTVVYQDNETLWRDTLAKNPACWMAHDSLGCLLEAKGQSDAAIAQYHEALRLKSNDADTHNNLAIALAATGQMDAAISQYQEAVRLKPHDARMHNNLGIALAATGQTNAAISQYEEAVRLNPNDAWMRNNFGLALARQDRTDEAILQFQEAVRLNPNDAWMHNNFGLALARQGQTNEAILQFQEAVRLNPDDARLHNNFGLALARQGQTNEAIIEFQEALRVRPDYAEARNNLRSLWLQNPEVLGTMASTLDGQGKYAEAIQFYRAALKAQPDQEEVLNNLAWLLATCPDAAFRNGPEAVRLASHACELTGHKQPLLIGTLAAAQAEAGDFPAAIATAQRAETLATALRLEDVAARNRELLQLYRQGQPFHEKKEGE